MQRSRSDKRQSSLCFRVLDQGWCQGFVRIAPFLPLISFDDGSGSPCALRALNNWSRVCEARVQHELLHNLQEIMIADHADSVPARVCAAWDHAGLTAGTSTVLIWARVQAT